MPGVANDLFESVQEADQWLARRTCLLGMDQPRANAANIAPPATTGTRSSNIQPPPVAHPGVARTLAEAGCPAPFATGAAGCRTDPDWSGIDGGALLLSAASGDPSAGAPAPSTGHASAEISPVASVRLGAAPVAAGLESSCGPELGDGSGPDLDTGRVKVLLTRFQPPRLSTVQLLMAIRNRVKFAPDMPRETLWK